MDDATTYAVGWSLTTTVEPAEEPVTLAAAKEHLRVEHAAEDSLIARLVKSARRMTEAVAARCWVTQTVVLGLADFPRGCRHAVVGGRVVPGLLQLPVEPVRSVTAVRYWDHAGVQRTMTAGTDYLAWVAHSPPLLYPAPGWLWPHTQLGRVPAVEVEMVAGYGTAAAVPAEAVEAILLQVGEWYERRGDDFDPRAAGLAPAVMSLCRLLHPGSYR